MVTFQVITSNKKDFNLNYSYRKRVINQLATIETAYKNSNLFRHFLPF